MSVVIGDSEGLINDVGHVQKELEKFDVKRAVDANEIYELLETHSFRSDRVQFVTTRLLLTLGIQNNSDEDVISISDDSVDYLDELLSASSPECSVINDSVLLSVPDSYSAAMSAASTSHTKVMTVCKVNDPTSSLLQNQTQNGSEVHKVEPTTVAADASESDNCLVLNTFVERHNSEPNNGNAVSASPYQNDDLICDVNNNDPNNNTEYEVSVQIEDKQEKHLLPPRETDDSEMEFEDQDDICSKLLEEARLIHRIVPRQNLEQIYSYLEANLYHKNRLQIVMQEFLRMELTPELCHSAMNNDGSVVRKSQVKCLRSNNVLETQIVSEPQPSTSYVRNTETVNKSAGKTNICHGPQPSTSGTSTLKRKALNSNTVSGPRHFTSNKAKMNSKGITVRKKSGMKLEQGDSSKSLLPSTSGTSTLKRKALNSNTVSGPCHFTSNKAKMNSKGITVRKKSGMKLEQGDSSKSLPPDGKSSSKDGTTSQSSDYTMPTAKSDIGTIIFATDTNQPNIWEVSSTSASSTSAGQNSGITDNVGEVGITSTTNLNNQTNADAKNERVLEVGTFESSRFGLDDVCVSKLGTSQVGVHATVETLKPSSSSASLELINTASTQKSNKRKAESEEFSSSKVTKIGEISLSAHGDVAAVEIMLTRNQLKYKSVLMEMFPDADPQYVKQLCLTIETEESFDNMVTSLLENNYPRRVASKEVPVELVCGPSTSSMPDKEKVETEYETLVAILPNADPKYLQEALEKFGNDENAMKTFVTEALERKDYPTREDYRKRQEALALKNKYTEEFSVESFLDVIPDPFKYFLEEKKSDKMSAEHAMAYLRERYRKIRHEDIKRAFGHNNYNLTLTCQELDGFTGCLRKIKRSEWEFRIPPEVNIPFLQEVSSSLTLCMSL
jgi:hypothetical protein